jgi:hypothetical protein
VKNQLLDVKDYSLTDGLQFFQAHGLYEEWRKQAIAPPAIH